MQRAYGDERKREQAYLGAELTDRLAGPQPPEVTMSPEHTAETHPGRLGLRLAHAPDGSSDVAVAALFRDNHRALADLEIVERRFFAL